MSERVVIGDAELYLGDCLEVLPMLAVGSVDAVVCDPPYELGFMGKAWDKSGVAYRVDLWCEVWRVLKPGGHLLAFGGARTYHRLACAIEDAGFEIRDQIMWLYGSGFPKSLDISKAIDKAAGAEREVVGQSDKQAAGYIRRGRTDEEVFAGVNVQRIPATITAPATPAARQWQGWGSALKPAHEPICVARKPLSERTIAANVLRWGCGGINVDGGRIETGESDYDHPGDLTVRPMAKNVYTASQQGAMKITQAPPHALGRFPANVILDEDAAAALDEQSGTLTSGDYPATGRLRTYNGIYGKPNETGGGDIGPNTGGASRFFYCAKASRSERDAGLWELPGNYESRIGDGIGDAPSVDSAWRYPQKNGHPTVKPLSLMRYLCRLVTPPGGVILDPFLGSGSTGCAAALEGFAFIGIEKEADFMTIAERRIAHWQSKAALPLFELAEIEAAQ